ncbi:MAG: disulfide bond formation protein B [Motiliproteus sp.]
MNYLDNSRSRYRSLNFVGLATCVSALLFAVIFIEQRLGLPPGPLCIASRLIVLALACVFFLAWAHNPRQFGQRCYATLGGLLSIIGIGLNLRHIWLQSLPADLTTECGPGLEYLLQNVPLQEVLSTLINGSGECTDTHWTLIGLTLPQQTLLLFLFLSLIAFIQLRKRHRSYFR